MKVAILYHSYHHGNTRRVVEAMCQGHEVDVFDVTQSAPSDISCYDLVGFASGIYCFTMSRKLLSYGREHLRSGQRVFLVYTYGGESMKNRFGRHGREMIVSCGCELVGEFGCLGFNTYGPFGWFGGTAKGHPSECDLRRARVFFKGILEACPSCGQACEG